MRIGTRTGRESSTQFTQSLSRAIDQPPARPPSTKASIKYYYYYDYRLFNVYLEMEREFETMLNEGNVKVKMDEIVTNDWKLETDL